MRQPAFNYDAKVFLEGIELPAKGLAISENVSGISTISVEIPSVGAYRLLPRTLIHAFAANEEGKYILRFSGEVAEPAQTWTPRASATVITGYSFDNHYDAIPILSYIQGGGSSGGGGLEGVIDRSDSADDLLAPSASGGSGTSGADWSQKSHELSIMGGGFSYALNPDSGDDFIEVKEMGSSGQGGDLKVSSPAEMFPILYKTNKYWKNQGEKTRMSDSDKYYFYEWYNKAKNGSSFKKILQEYIKLLAGQMLPSATNFRDFLNLYLQLTFCSYAFNQTRLDHQLLLLAGFEYVLPPLCNLVFPHQFNSVSTYSTTLAAPTRAYAIEGSYNNGGSGLEGVVDRSDAADDLLAESGNSGGGGGGQSSGVAMVGYPDQIDALIQSGSWSKLREVVTDEEKVKGIVAMKVTLPAALGQAVIKVFGNNTAPGYREFMKNHISLMFAKAHNSAASSTVTCIYNPYIQVGLPLAFFKPLAELADIKEGVSPNDLIVVLGYVSGVRHIFDKASKTAQTVISVGAAETLVNGMYPRPLPYWMQGLSPSDFDGIYGEILGCGALHPGSSVIQGLGGTSTSFETKGTMGSLNPEKEVFEAVAKIYDAYETKQTDLEKVEFAESLQRRPVVYMEEALAHFKFESDRAALVKELRAAILERSIIFEDLAQHSKVGSGDVAAGDMKDGFAATLARTQAEEQTASTAGKKTIRDDGKADPPKTGAKKPANQDQPAAPPATTTPAGGSGEKPEAPVPTSTLQGDAPADLTAVDYATLKGHVDKAVTYNGTTYAVYGAGTGSLDLAYTTKPNDRGVTFTEHLTVSEKGPLPSQLNIEGPPAPAVRAPKISSTTPFDATAVQ